MIRAALPGDWWHWVFGVALGLTGCAHPGRHDPAGAGAASAAVESCRGLFRDLDARMDAAGVSDAGAHRVRGFDYLRSTRFIAARRPQRADDIQTLRAVVDAARAEDLSARAHELANAVPFAVAATLPTLARVEACGRTLAAHDLEDPDQRTRILDNLTVPDDYAGWRRAAGLYALARIPFAAGIRRWQAETRATFAAPPEWNSADRRQLYPPSGRLARADVAHLLRASPRDALGRHQFRAGDLNRLFETYAPVFEIETRGTHDRPGALAWTAAAELTVDDTRPVVYRRLVHTRVGASTVPQLVYSLWFSGRPARGRFDLLAGRYDEVIWRVTLADDGAPLVFDSIHGCGCYHQFFTTPRARVKPPPDRLTEWAFVPSSLADVSDGERVVVRLASATHYLQHVRLERDVGDAERYTLADADTLRALADPGGATRSIYDRHGFVRGSERLERALFWPMGIANAGAMRQWGRHATAFVGRRHFDDADLLDRRFDFTP